MKLLRSKSLLAVLTPLLLLAPLTVSASSASAATPTISKSSIRTVYGDHTLTMSWHSVSGANAYQLRYANNPKFKGAKVVKTSGTTRALTKLQNRKPYYVQLSALNGSQTVAKSATVKATPTDGYPAVLPTVKVGPADKLDQIKVSWTPLQKATRVVVMASSDNHETQGYFHSAWLPATTTSTVLDIPQQYRWLLGSNRANAIYVKVGQYNNASATKIMHVRSDAVKYRLSNSNFYGFPKATPVGKGTKIRVATYNIQSIPASDPGHPWSERKDRVAANIAYSQADLIGLQEDDAVKSIGYQHRQVAHLLADAAHGNYRMAGDLPADYRYNFDLYDAWFYYKPNKLTLLQQGTVSPRDDLHVAWPKTMGSTNGGWAKFRVNASGKEFYALNIHLPNQANTDLKIREAAALSKFINDKAGDLPTIFLGDLNANAYRDGYCAATKLVDLGWTDTATAPKRSNSDMQSANSPVGYPDRPHRAVNVSTGRIDYIMVQRMGTASHYMNQNVLNGDGSVNKTYQGSDHNLQWADLAF